ncbi:MAG: DNA-binding response regulator [SAR116 cluster bacterium MED-G05]|nr:MAG: DNA-binding response regulator [SAR116 cluster bacterium MED-G05]
MAIRILVADDEPNQLELLAYNLTSAGFEVLRAEDGQQALDMIEEYRPDLAIIDWMMPYMSGIDVCRTLRARTETKHFPIILLSARGEEGDRTLGLDIGADDYISKPFSPREMVSRVRALLRRAHPSLTDEVLEFHDLIFNQTTMIVTRCGTEVSLGPKESRLLAILMERPGRVFSRTQLLDMVWGHGVFVEERTVDVHISRLRKAISVSQQNGATAPNLIYSIRGSGYALRQPHDVS